MELIRQHPIVEGVIGFVILLILYFFADKIIFFFKLKITKIQFIILIAGLYRLFRLILTWL